LRAKAKIATIILLCAGIALAFTVTVPNLAADPNTRKIKLAWDPNEEADLDGYKIYYKCCVSGPPYDGSEAYQGDSPVLVYLEDLQNNNNPKFELDGLSKQNDYYFTVTAFDSEFNESAFSREASTVAAFSDDGTGGSSSSDGGGGGGGGCFIQSAASFGCIR